MGRLSTGRDSDKPGTVPAVGAVMGRYHISDMIPVALPQHRAGAGLTNPCS